MNQDQVIDYLNQKDLSGISVNLLKQELFGNQYGDYLYRLFSPNGLCYITDNLFKFAEKYSLSDSGLANMLSGRTTNHKGWRGFKV